MSGVDIAEFGRNFRAEMGKVIAGQTAILDGVLAALLADGHVLLEGVPGLGKTLLVRTLGRVMGLPYGRVQFTPDLMPSDLTGTQVFDPRTTEFAFRAGPLFAGLLLADEINRTPPKTQSALLEAMEERRITVDGVSHMLPRPFIVVATQNPVEFEGTYPLPEAQQDRFLLHLRLDYPSVEEELAILKLHHEGFRPRALEDVELRTLADPDMLVALQDAVRQTRVEEETFRYINQFVRATREARDISVGGSPRAGLALLACAKVSARLAGRDYVNPDDVKTFALPALRHRITLRAEAEIEGIGSDDVLREILSDQVVPR